MEVVVHKARALKDKIVQHDCNKINVVFLL